MGSKSSPAAQPVYYMQAPDNSGEMALLEKQLEESKRQADLQASLTEQQIAESQRQAELMQKQLEEQLALQEEMFKAPKDVELGTAPTNTDFKTFTPSTPDVKLPSGLEGTRLNSGTSTTPKPTTSKTKLKDPLGLGLSGINLGLNT